MDANKREVLVEIGYQVLDTCGRCAHAELNPNTDWGTCRITTYPHAKHIGDWRDLSINRNGTCPKFTAQDRQPLGGFEEFTAQ